nr:MAG TPA: hypothetical protein [Podoviridae sp. ctY3D12]
MQQIWAGYRSLHSFLTHLRDLLRSPRSFTILSSITYLWSWRGSNPRPNDDSIDLTVNVLISLKNYYFPSIRMSYSRGNPFSFT